MNKYLVWLPAFMVLGAVIYKPVKEATEARLVNKNISFSVYKSSSYTSVVYNNTSAKVYIIVEKVNTKGQHTIVWDKKFDPKYLSRYPSVENALKQNITIHNLNREKEYLIVHYILTYNSKESELQMQDSIIMKDDNFGRVDISIWSVHISISAHSSAGMQPCYCTLCTWSNAIQWLYSHIYIIHIKKYFQVVKCETKKLKNG